MYWLEKSGLKDLLPELLKTRVYAGISAGSMVTSGSQALKHVSDLYYENKKVSDTDGGLGFIPFYFRPHLNSPDFPKVRKDYLEKLAKDIPETIYALDDQSAIKVDGDKIEVISEGQYLVFKQ
uniref:Peptidase S51 dipeptidase E n=1 Tax=uncultured microorganism TaxID=358574 RepID=F8UH79_9ZZZZ|nr:peptidase S51 dipeptidase E [uncultured microorganism]